MCEAETLHGQAHALAAQRATLERSRRSLLDTQRMLREQFGVTPDASVLDEELIAAIVQVDLQMDHIAERLEAIADVAPRHTS